MKKTFTASIFIFIFCAFAFGQNSNCPAISVTGPMQTVQPDGEMDFTASVSGIDTGKVGYKWTVSKGAIVQGQGTPKILVSIKGLYDDTITATVEFLNLPEGCSNSVSETVFAVFHFSAQQVDQMTSSSRVNYDDLDAIIGELKSKPDWKIYFISYPDENSSEKDANKKLNQIGKYLSKKNISDERMVFLKGEEEKDEIQIWLVPPGAEPTIP